MNSFTGTAVDSSSSKFTQTVIPPARSDTGTSYPDYAPPTYEAATSLPAPSITSRSETHSSPDDEPSTESIEPDTKATPSRDPLDPMPSCFSRNVPTDAAHQALSYPFIVHAKPGKKLLDDAFDTFSSNILEKYNVFDHDWARLIEDIRIAAQLTKGEKVTAKVLPVTKYIGCTGYFVSRAIEKKMKRKNAASVNALLEVWNEQFFRPRRLEITLCRGIGASPVLLSAVRFSTQLLIDHTSSLDKEDVVGHEEPSGVHLYKWITSRARVPSVDAGKCVMQG
ncbi:hypothetical protein RHS01_09281 [Rhizoctonia solani]|uniref:Uncharacterized protein n=1 Tax=Rhizoctonia solani TaxID=456999 RepID=A0A8H7LY45_9AGAM|nr:hypothetical protein RHS01_09281 [Rhizoctonia solani]